jgi:AcrR family transcriptional regulator
MKPNPRPSEEPASSLNEARKAFARNHICAAARELFFRQGYAATTFEQIALAAGTRRTTLYSHFADKAEILRAIGEDYHIGLCALVAELDGPHPSRAAIDAWIAKLVAFVIRERTPAMLLIGLAIGQDMPPAVQEVSERFHDALAQRLPAFADVIKEGADQPLRRAWMKVVLRELSLACLEAARAAEDGAESGDGQAILIVAADLFERFVNDNGR